MEMKWDITKEEDGMTVKSFLREKQLFSRRMLTNIKFHGGGLLLNRQPVTVRAILKNGDHLVVALPEEKVSEAIQAEKLQLAIHYEDDAVLVVNKPAHMAVLPSMNHKSHTLANGLIGYYQSKGIRHTVHIVTRLDADTSGLVLIAKNSYVHSLLSLSGTADIRRTYHAIVEGDMEEAQGEINLPIGRKDGSIIERTVSVNGKEARTLYERLHTLPENHTLLKVTLDTGRTHQIRVHFSHLGHPLAGDTLYGGNTSFIERQALHCKELEFRHPLTDEWISLTAPYPEDFSV